MEEVIELKQGLYCPISVSDLATNNAKVRQNALREYSYVQNAAYRAFCRGPGRPQTAAFGRVYFETPNRRPLSANRADLHDCVVASKVPIEERTADAANYHVTEKASCPIQAERRILSRATTARRTLRHSAKESNDEQAVGVTGSEQPLEDVVCVKNKEETHDFVIEPDSGSDRKRSDTENSEEMNQMKPGEDLVSESIDRQLIVYHSVDSGCSCTAAVNINCDALVNGRACNCEQQFLISSYSVEMHGEGYQSTPGLGNFDSQENKVILDLLQKQLFLRKHQRSREDKSQDEQSESLNLLISQLVNVKPPKGYIYYFAYGPDINTKRFMTYVHRKLEDMAWALLYGFKLTSPDEQDYQKGSVWPKCKYSPQSAVEGRLYLISQQEADKLDEHLDSKQTGLLAVLLPVWLMDSDENACCTAEYCLPALVHILPHELLN